MAKLTIEAPEFEMPDEGKYVFKLTQVTNDPKGCEYPDTTRLDFELLGTQSERDKTRCIQQAAFVSRPATPTNKYGRFISAILGRQLEENEVLETDDWIGGLFCGTIIHEKRDKGGMRAVINDKNLQVYDPKEPFKEPDVKKPAEDNENLHKAKVAQTVGILKAKGIPFALEYTGLEDKTKIMGWLRERSIEELDGIIGEISDPFADM